jgi:hypothetical protein
MRYVPARYIVFPILAFGLLSWCWKIFIYLHGMDGWK